MPKRRSGERILGPYRNRRGFIIVEVAADGHRTSVYFETEEDAVGYRAEFETELKREDHTTETAWAEYERWMTEQGNKSGSIATTRAAVRSFFPVPLPLHLLTERRCRKLYEEMRTRPSKATGRPLAVDTHRNRLAEVKTFLGWCQECGWLGKNPAENLVGTGKRRHRGKSLGKSGHDLRVKEARRLYTTALDLAEGGDEGATAALVAMLLGMRASEIVSRTVRDLDEDEAPGDLLWIPCAKTPAGRRTLEVPEALRPLLVELAEGKAPGEYLFAGRLGRPHWRDWVRDQVHRVCGLAKVPPVTAHAMRGLLATLSLDRGTAGHVVAATLGHADDGRTASTSYAAPGSAAAGARKRGLKVLDGGKGRR